MIDLKSNADEMLRQRLYSLSVDDKEYWSFRGNSNREYGHGLFQYPAMMVPQLIRALLNEILSLHPNIKRVGDPFMGSGTVMTETIMRGLGFWGTDINPLAILLCKVKSGPFFLNKLDEKIKNLKKNIISDNQESIDVQFNNCDKWFREDVQVDLSRIRRNIKREKSLWARRFFWVALAETVRNTSNSRTSTFKLHTRTKSDIETKDFNPINLFSRILDRNIILYEAQANRLSEFGQLQKGNYTNEVDISLADIRDYRATKQCDLIVTSPPYGDNATTVPYGQYSYLPLLWIDLSDIDASITPDLFTTTRTIDASSLGGSLKVTSTDYEHLCERSKAFEEYAEIIKTEPPDRLRRVTAFFRDLNNSLPAILDALSTGGLMVWILGNRKVGGKRVPFDKILVEMLEYNNAIMVNKIVRSIPSKRMAIKNNVAETMLKESIIVIRKN